MLFFTIEEIEKSVKFLFDDKRISTIEFEHLTHLLKELRSELKEWYDSTRR